MSRHLHDAFESASHRPRASDDLAEMLQVVGVASLDALIDEAIPPAIRARRRARPAGRRAEHEYLARPRDIALKNKIVRSFIGLGYHDTITPAVIQPQRPRESRLVHALHAVPGRDRAGPPRVAPQLPDDGERT